MSTPASALPPFPQLDTSQQPGWFDWARKQQIAQMLMGSLQQSMNSPSPQAQAVGPYAVQAKRGLLQNLAPLVEALMANKAQAGVAQAQKDYYTPPQPTPAGPTPADSGQTFNGPTGGINVPGQPPPGLIQPQAAPQNPLIPPGMTARQAQQLYNVMGPEKYAETFVAPNYKQPDVVAQLRAAGIEPTSAEGQAYQRTALANAQATDLDKQLRAAGLDPTSPEALAVKRAALAKSTTNVQDVRPGSTLYDVNQHSPLFTGPDNGVNTTWNNGAPTQTTIPGALAATQAGAAARTAGAQANTPIKLGTDENGRDIFGFPAPPGPARAAPPPTAPAPTPTTPTAPGAPPSGAARAPGSTAPLNATAPGQTVGPGAIESQKAGAQAGRAFEADLNHQSRGAVEILKSTSELKSLAQQAGGVSVGNDAKARIGALMMAAGVDPQTVQHVTGVDAGAIQAAEKQTASLAKASVHEISSRGTNLDLATFLKNNPNLNMNDPAAFARTVDFIERGANSTIDEHAAFADYKKTHPQAENWETEFNALWNQKQRAAIQAGKTNSARPSSSQLSLAELQAEARRRGLQP